MALVGPYFSSKTEIGKTDIFIDVDNKKRIGLKYLLEVVLISADAEKVKYGISFIHVIMDNEATMCLPFLNEIEYTKYIEGK